MKRTKKMSLLILALIMSVSIFAGCGKKNEKKELVVWTFTDEIEKIVNNYYKKDHPDLPYDIVVRVIPNEQYQTKLDPVFSTGKGAPDVFALEGAYAKKYINSGHLASLSADGLNLEGELVEEQYPYVVDMMRGKDGVLRGATFQATPGAFYYRRSLAEQYLGTSDPAGVQQYVKDFSTFIATGEQLNIQSNGKVKIVSSFSDLYKVFYAARTSPWIVDNKLVIDPKIDELMETTKALQEKKLTNETVEWSEGWFADMSGDSAFGYFLPTWGLSYVLKPNAKKADGSTTSENDWAVTQGPAPYFSGGTWLSVYDKSNMKEEAKALVEYITSNEGFLKSWAKDTGDFLSNKKVVEQIKGDFKEDFLGGQNHYELFASHAGDIDASIVSGDDGTIGGLLSEQVIAYALGEKQKEQAIEDFKLAVKNAFPDYQVE
ncbi:ABC transporter substrate-binding protein [Paenibacillus paeoniae]|uniref:Carbohydrate ABC transporter substrate-binding protein n=1 Tax=Paenibacillus paeoniae TaxID=2292705 RepID=A0A371PH00_9BACL|nr:ABC transporter substrate-binding protein [Paenibacillus paeoniae]REK75135.1 carbohydrate ABC transporter substrate-binding protein [Paenibacillus paeoniae]